MDNNEVILQPEIAGSVNVKIGKVTKVNYPRLKPWACEVTYKSN